MNLYWYYQAIQNYLKCRRKNKIAIGGDGQVTMGDMAFKQKAVKVRRFEMDKNVVLGGFAGAAADALTLFEKFEQIESMLNI